MGERVNANSPMPQELAAAPPAGSGPALARFITEIFRAWRSKRLPFAVLRNYEGLPGGVSNDIDVLVERRRYAEIERTLFEAARHSGFALHNRIEFESTAYFFFEPGSLEQIQIDLYHTLAWRGFEMISPALVLGERIEHDLFATPQPVHEAAISLLNRLIALGKVGPKYKAKIAAVFRAEPVKARTLLASSFGKNVAEAVVANCLAERWESVEQLTPRLRRNLVLRSLAKRPLKTL